MISKEATQTTNIPKESGNETKTNQEEKELNELMQMVTALGESARSGVLGLQTSDDDLIVDSICKVVKGLDSCIEKATVVLEDMKKGT